MSIINKRNAVLGWAVWTVGKQTAKYKAKRAVPRRSGDSKLPDQGRDRDRPRRGRRRRSGSGAGSVRTATIESHA